MLNDKKYVELIWADKYDRLEKGEPYPIEKPNLPFQVVETVNKPRQKDIEEGLFNADQVYPEREYPKGYPKDWKNILIWGDNKLVMSSLLKQGWAGKINLIYIDPPFFTGANFSVKTTVHGQEVEKEPSIIEERAYKDTWSGGISTYLKYMYERLALMKDLLAEDGSIYVHLDWHVGHYVKVMMDELFGYDRFQNEIIWKRTTSRGGSNYYNHVHDIILFYTKGENAVWNQQYEPYKDEYIDTMFRGQDADGRKWRKSPLTAPGKSNGMSGETWKGITPGKIGKGRHWAIPGYIRNLLSEKAQNDTIKALDELDKMGRIIRSKSGMPDFKQYLDELNGVELQSLWLDIGVSTNYDYDTEKPELLLSRIIQSSSNPGDIVADFFCGSGTTLAVAEKLGRRWIGADLSKFAIQVTRKRLLGIQESNNL